MGKTSLTQRFAKNIFSSDYKKTLGVDFLMKKKYIKAIDREVEFMMWDTAGQEYYDAITKKYYRGASGALIVFSITDRQSFLDVQKWLEKVKGECGEIPVFLIQNKIDLMNESKINEKEILEISKQLGLTLFKVSVKDDIMVNDVFENLAVEYFKKGKKIYLFFT